MGKYNGLLCTNCEDIIYSRHRHDFVSCTCGKIFVDGGQDYFRFGGDDKYFKHVTITTAEE